MEVIVSVPDVRSYRTEVDTINDGSSTSFVTFSKDYSFVFCYYYNYSGRTLSISSSTASVFTNILCEDGVICRVYQNISKNDSLTTNNSQWYRILGIE